ncbi:MAG: restriction endonuclease [Ignavibacteriales bacterium]
MAEITQARTGQFVRKLFEFLLAEPAGLPAAVAVSKVASSFELTEFESGVYPSGGQRFGKILRFATVDCVKAGWLQKDKGFWSVTEAGEKAYRKYTDPAAFYKEACRLYAKWKAERDALSGAVDPATDKIASSAEKLSVSYEEALEQAWGPIEAFLRTTDPFEFQDIVAHLLRAMDYYVHWVSPPGKDGGVDIIAYTDPLGAQGPRIKVQVKRRADRTDIDGLKAFVATINSGDIGIFVCLAGFTRAAEEFARNQETRRVTLLDARRLVELWIEHHDELDEEARQALPLVPIYFLAPRE